MISAILSRLVILFFGTLYPAYSSFKAVRTKNVKEYIKWMMYWVVFALFTSVETFTDVLFSWFPFYYEIKVTLVLWLLSPATRGSSILYKKFVHPFLSSREENIDEYINRTKERSYKQVLEFGTTKVSALMQAAVKSITQFPSTFGLPNLQSDETYPAALEDDLESSENLTNLLDFSDDTEDEYIPEEIKVKKEKKNGSLQKQNKGDSPVVRRSNRKTKQVKPQDFFESSD